MQNKRLLIVIALTAMVLAPLSSQAFTVDFDGTNATGIRNLEVMGTFYNVVFSFASAEDIYGTPPIQFDFMPPDLERQIVRATKAVNDALDSIQEVTTVGPQISEVYYIGHEYEDSADVIGAFAGSYDDRSPGEWDAARFKDDYGFFGVNEVPISKSETYAEFTVVPIPAAVWLLGGGLIGLLGLRRRFSN